MGRLRSLIYAGCASRPFLALMRAQLPQSYVAVLMYHELAPDDVDLEAWTVVRESEFLRQVEYLTRYYDVVGIDQASAYLQGSSTPERPKAVITFDDGARGNATVLLPIVEKLKLPVTVYVATGQVQDATPYWFDRIVNALQTDHVLTIDLRAHGLNAYMINRSRGAGNWACIQQVLQDLKSLAPQARAEAVEVAIRQAGSFGAGRASRIEPLSIAEVKSLAACSWVTIGAHSHCHNLLTQISAAEGEHSVRHSKCLLEEWSGRPVAHFAYPNGTHDNSVVEVIRRNGFVSGVTTEGRLWESEDSVHRIPRLGVGRYDSMEQFKLNLVGGIRRLMPWQRSSTMRAS